jgi:hypothetical protein
LLAVLLTLLGVAQGCATNPPERFASPEQAVGSLVRAIRANDQADVLAVLGSDAKDIVDSGDAVADQQARERFLEAYDTKHKLVTEPNGEVTLVIGPKDWPLPIPIVKDEAKNEWYFDTETGRDEIINRRIGRNELSTIQTCLAIVDAQREYALADPDGDGVREYAGKFFSDPGKKNGLYWQTQEGEPLSPMGELVAGASGEGYTRSSTGQPHPYHGYYYRILTTQGPAASGGTSEYVVGGKMIGGFALIASPADYGNSGIKTFMTNLDGVVYEKDLGDDTEKLAKAINSFDPGEGWSKVDPPAPDAEP